MNQALKTLCHRYISSRLGKFTDLLAFCKAAGHSQTDAFLIGHHLQMRDAVLPNAKEAGAKRPAKVGYVILWKSPRTHPDEGIVELQATNLQDALEQAVDRHLDLAHDIEAVMTRDMFESSQAQLDRKLRKAAKLT